MKNGHEESGHFQQWEKLYKDALFESEVLKIPRRLELAKHAVLDRLEDVTCTRKKRTYQAQVLEAPARCRSCAEGAGTALLH